MKSSSATTCGRGFSGLPVGDEDLVGAFGLLGCGRLFAAPLLVVVGRARHAVVAPSGRGAGGELELAPLVGKQMRSPPSRPWRRARALRRARGRAARQLGHRRHRLRRRPQLRALLEARGMGYVLALACDHRVVTNTGTHRVDARSERLPARAWHSSSAGPGAKCQRLYDWAALDLHEPSPGRRGRLIRRHPRTGELAFYRTHSAQPVPLSTLVRVARAALGHRGELPDHQEPHRPRRTPGPHLDVLAPLDDSGHARQSIPRRAHRQRPCHASTRGPADPAHPRRATSSFLALTHAGMRAHDLAHRLSWSRWRRRDQHRARAGHHQGRAHT